MQIATCQVLARRLPLQWLGHHRHSLRRKDGLGDSPLRAPALQSVTSANDLTEAQVRKKGCLSLCSMTEQTLDHVQVLMRGKYKNTVPRRHKNQ